MIRWFLEKFMVRPLFREDPYFRIQVREDLDRGLVSVTVSVIRSSAAWQGKFEIESSADYPVEIQVPDVYKHDGEYFVLEQVLTEKSEVEIEFEAAPLQSGGGRLRFWFERKVGIGGQIAVIGTVFGQADQEAIQKNKDYQAKHWRKWLDDNPDWPDNDSG